MAAVWRRSESLWQSGPGVPSGVMVCLRVLARTGRADCRRSCASFPPSSGSIALSILCVALWRGARGMIEWLCIHPALGGRGGRRWRGRGGSGSANRPRRPCADDARAHVGVPFCAADGEQPLQSGAKGRAAAVSRASRAQAPGRLRKPALQERRVPRRRSITARACRRLAAPRLAALAARATIGTRRFAARARRSAQPALIRSRRAAR